MSIALMTAAFKTPLNHTHKFVLVALCDNANDQGECYPSVSMLSEKTSLSDRAVQKSISYLVEMKYIKRDIRNGRSTYYYIADPKTWLPTPERGSPRTAFPPNVVHPTPEPCSPPPPNVVHPTPERGSPITIIEPSIESSGNHQGRKKAAPVDLPNWLPVEAWENWTAYRKSIKAPLNEHMTKLCIAKLSKLRDQGNDPVEVIDQSIMSGKWTGLFEVKDSLQARGSPTGSKLGAAGQATAAAAQRLIEKFRAENEQTS